MKASEDCSSTLVNEQHHEDDGPHKSFKQGKVRKTSQGFEHHEALFNPSSETGKRIAQLQTYKHMAIHLN